MTRLILVALVAVIALGWAIGCASRPAPVAQAQQLTERERLDLAWLEARKQKLLDEDAARADARRQHDAEIEAINQELEKTRLRNAQRDMEREQERKDSEAEAEGAKRWKDLWQSEGWRGGHNAAPAPGDMDHWIWDDEEQAHYARAFLRVAAAPAPAQEPPDDTNGGLIFASVIAGFLLTSVLVALKYHYGREDALAGLSHRGGLFRSDALRLKLESRDTTTFPVAARLLCHYQPVSVGRQGRNSRISDIIDSANGQGRWEQPYEGGKA